MFRRPSMMTPDQSDMARRAPSAEHADVLTRAADRPMTGAATQSLPGSLRPGAVPIDAAGGVSQGRESRSLAGGRRPSAVPLESEARVAEKMDEPESGERRHRISNGGGRGSGTPRTPPPPSAPTATPSAPSASLTLTGNTYADNATESDKTVTYNATWSGGAKEDYIMVQWVKGYMKDPKGKPFTATVYGKSDTDINFADWVIDSVDEDPAYWSKGGVRWRYTVDAPNKFSATDSPGPMTNSDGVGAESKLNYKMAVYKNADVPTKTTGTISATPLSSFQPWDYNVVVQGGGKFKH